MGLTILVVDDSRVARMSLRRQVGEIVADAHFIEAGSYDEALEKLGTAQPDVALIDFNMPGHDGLELARELAQRVPGTRMALVTANIQDAVARRAADLGMTFIPKPAAPDQLKSFLAGAGG